ncbi:hypothetical protein P3L10_000393 [Capsicum annuum]
MGKKLTFGSQQVITFLFAQMMEDNGEEFADMSLLVGFWPARIFTELNGFATSVEYGGVVYSPPGVPEPSMGYGYFPVGDMIKGAY